jgi:hypothetical protein
LVSDDIAVGFVTALMPSMRTGAWRIRERLFGYNLNGFPIKTIASSRAIRVVLILARSLVSFLGMSVVVVLSVTVNGLA